MDDFHPRNTPEQLFDWNQREEPGGPVTPEREPKSGWALLIGLFTLLILLQLVTYLQPRQEDADVELATESKQMAMRIRMLSVVQPMSSKSDLGKSRKELQKEANELFEKRDQDVAALARWSIVTHEAGGKLDKDTLQRLAKAKNEDVAAIARVYGRSNLGEADVRAVRQQLNDGDELERLAIVHAEERAKLPSSRSSWISAPRLFAMFGLVSVLGLVLFGGIVAWIVYFAKRSAGDWAPWGLPTGRLSAAVSNAQAGRAVLMLIAMLAVGGIVQVVLHRVARLPDTASGLIALAVSAAFALALLRAPIDGHRVEPNDLGVRRPLLPQVGWGLLGFAMELPVVLILMLVGLGLFSWLPPPHHPLSDELTRNPSAIKLIELFLTAVVFAPVFEELIFRGVLFPAMASRMRKVAAAAILNGLLFAMIHPTGIPVWPALAGVGAMGCFLVYQRGSVIPAIVMHACHNGTIMAFALLV